MFCLLDEYQMWVTMEKWFFLYDWFFFFFFSLLKGLTKRDKTNLCILIDTRMSFKNICSSLFSFSSSFSCIFLSKLQIFLWVFSLYTSILIPHRIHAHTHRHSILIHTKVRCLCLIVAKKICSFIGSWKFIENRKTLIFKEMTLDNRIVFNPFRLRYCPFCSTRFIRKCRESSLSYKIKH